jgi:hypothetical protein
MCPEIYCGPSLRRGGGGGGGGGAGARTRERRFSAPPAPCSLAPRDDFWTHLERRETLIKFCHLKMIGRYAKMIERYAFLSC